MHCVVDIPDYNNSILRNEEKYDRANLHILSAAQYRVELSVRVPIHHEISYIFIKRQ